MPWLSPDPLVSTEWLAGHLDAPGLVVLDASWYLPGSGRDARAEHRAGHLPGARFFDLDAISDHATALPHMMPAEADFAAAVGALGVSNQSEVVVYDGSGANLSAARVWWMFRAFGHPGVHLLDGGDGKWRAEGRALERGELTAEPARFRARLDRSRIRTMAEVRQLLGGEVQVVDARPAGRFRGSDPEPRPGIRSGHIPGALSLPHATLVRSDGTQLTGPELEERLRSAGVRPDRPVIATCGSGTSACAVLLALTTLGREDHALYDGAWTEWAASGQPIETG